MNSAEDLEENDVITDENEPDNQNQFTTPDNNANVNDTNNIQSKGAIPKTKPVVKTKSAPKKTLKINNNVEDISSLNCNLKNNVLSCNGAVNGLTYLDVFKSSNTSPSSEKTTLSDEACAEGTFDDPNESSNCSSCNAGDSSNLFQEPSTSSSCDRLKIESSRIVHESSSRNSLSSLNLSDANCVNSNELSSNSNELCVNPNEPCKNSQESCKNSQDSYKNLNEPCKNAQESCKNPRESCKISQDSCKNLNEPCQKTHHSRKNSYESCKNLNEPFKSSNEPFKYSNESCKNSNEPFKKFNSKESSINSKDPRISSSDPCINSSDSNRTNLNDDNSRNSNEPSSTLPIDSSRSFSNDPPRNGNGDFTRNLLDHPRLLGDPPRNNNIPDNTPTDEQPTSSSSNRRDLILDLDITDSSTDDDLLSISDDGCIYTYKGDQVADLPSSFFSLDIPLPEIPEMGGPNRQQSASPEMDFLEMDFDPGPLGDGDSDCGDFQNSETFPEKPPEETEQKEDPSPKLNGKDSTTPAISTNDTFSLPGPSTSSNSRLTNNVNGFNPKFPKSFSTSSLTRKEAFKTESEATPWSCPISHRTIGSSYYRTSKRFHCQKGELISPSEKQTTDYPMRDFSKIKSSYYPVYKTEEEWKRDVGDSAMIWTEKEAILRQFIQIGPSACGATAVLNILTALRFPIPPLEKLQEFVTTRLRANTSPLTEYLMSRSVAGSTHEDLIEGLQKLSDGKIYARFFPMYPERIVNLECWLAHWIRNGAVPVATLNLQKCVGTIPDAWHHQMIFGVSPRGIFLTNPFECVEPSKLWSQLCSESILMVRREDVISRWNFKTDLPQLMKIMDVRWRNLNVVGQVANMIHEHRRELRPGFINTTHVKIPAAYESGITLAVTTDSNIYSSLKQCEELPLLQSYDVATALPSFYQP